MVVKLWRRLMNKNLFISSCIASRADLIILIETTDKSQHALVLSDLGKSDTMSFATAEKGSSPRVLECLSKKVQAQGTILYLELIQTLIRTYITPSTSPEERLYGALYSAFFVRLWKECLLEASKDPLRKHQTLSENYITSNIHACIELNMHSLIKFVRYCRDHNIPEAFIVEHLSSQPCESVFRVFRSMTSTESTVVNFNIQDLLSRAKRAYTLGKIMSSTANFEFHKKKAKPFVFDSLPPDSQINVIARTAFMDCVELFKNIGKSLISLNYIFKNKSYLCISGFTWSKTHIPLNMADIVERDQVISITEQETSSPLEEIADKASSADFSFISNLKEIYANELEEQVNLEIETSKFVNFRKQDGSYILVKKSSVLWMLFKKKNRISPDRMLRFLSNVTKSKETVPCIWVGEFALFRVNNQKVVAGQVLGFRYITGPKKNYSLEYCPIEAPENSGNLGINTLVSFYEISKNENRFVLNFLLNEYLNFINLNCLIKVITVIEDLSGKISVSEESSVDVLPKALM